jgi:hypothetical protein
MPATAPPTTRLDSGTLSVLKRLADGHVLTMPSAPGQVPYLIRVQVLPASFDVRPLVHTGLIRKRGNGDPQQYVIADGGRAALQS